jgi:hypothetical protein
MRKVESAIREFEKNPDMRSTEIRRISGSCALAKILTGIRHDEKTNGVARRAVMEKLDRKTIMQTFGFSGSNASAITSVAKFIKKVPEVVEGYSTLSAVSHPVASGDVLGVLGTKRTVKDALEAFCLRAGLREYIFKEDGPDKLLVLRMQTKASKVLREVF